MSDEARTLSVSQFLDIVKGVLSQAFEGGLWIQGEIEGFNGRGKHTYFTIVERESGKKAAVSIAIFEYQMRHIKPLLTKHRLELADGIKVRLYGTPDIYVDRGSFSFKVTNIDPRFTLGDLAGQRDEIVQRLKTRGLYQSNKLVPLPVAPLRIALITSIGSAAHADALHELEASGIGFNIFVHDVRVQGAEAVPTVVSALEQAGARTDVDVVMLVRGGGSKTDLLAFDSEEIAAAIGMCPLPVFTGIGHEVDTSIADEVAHRAFKTPTACAAGVVQLVQEFVQSTEDAWSQISLAASEMLNDAERSLSETAQAVKNAVVLALNESAHALRAAADRVRRRPSEVLSLATHSLKSASDRLRLLDPVNTMARGWSITRDANGKAIRGVGSLKQGQVMTTSFADGDATSTVETISTRTKQQSTSKKAGKK
jgi:exodeoxyribonuclease VII large subunit